MWSCVSGSQSVAAGPLLAVGRVVGRCYGDCLYITTGSVSVVATFTHLSLRHDLVDLCHQHDTHTRARTHTVISVQL